MDSSPAPMTVLYELHQHRPDILHKHEVYIDGGVRRGTDVLKALCLGARGVGLGRPFLWANAVWGEEGCRRVIESEYSISFVQAFLGYINVNLFDGGACSYEGGNCDGDEIAWCDED